MRGRLKKHWRGLALVGAGIGLLPSYLWAYSISGASEAPAILQGDTVIVNRAAYDLRLPYMAVRLFRTGSPQRWEMVQAELPMHIGLGIKRVIGLPGETVEVRENQVIINGTPARVRALDGANFSWVPAQAQGMGSSVVLEENHWVAYTPGGSQFRNSSAVQLGAGEYFLLGDNRDNSLDSRAFGPIARDKILGRVAVVLPTGARTTK